MKRSINLSLAIFFLLLSFAPPYLSSPPSQVSKGVTLWSGYVLGICGILIGQKSTRGVQWMLVEYVLIWFFNGFQWCLTHKMNLCFDFLVSCGASLHGHYDWSYPHVCSQQPPSLWHHGCNSCEGDFPCSWGTSTCLCMVSVVSPVHVRSCSLFFWVEPCLINQHFCYHHFQSCPSPQLERIAHRLRENMSSPQLIGSAYDI